MMHGELISVYGLVPYLLLSIPMALVAGWLAPKMGDSRALWVIVMLIPLVNSIALLFLPFRIGGAILDRLNGQAKTPDAPMSGSAA